MQLSATIITFNEEKNIQRVIGSLLFADEIIVVDSGSTDQTVSRAQNCHRKVKVVVKTFTGYGEQKNFAASLCRFPWILNIDADEVVSPELQGSVQKILRLPLPQVHSIYAMKRLTYFCGSPIYHGGWYPDWKARLYQKSLAQWTTPHVHEDLRPLTADKSAVGQLQGHLLHYSFPTVDTQIITNLRYASLGAKELLMHKKQAPAWWEVLLRPLVKFFECYVFKLGFLDGKRGIVIAINAAHSMFMKYSFAFFGMSDEKNPS